MLSYEVAKRWTTVKRAEKDDDVINNELREEACKLMELSGQRKFPCHRPLDTDLGGWKLARTHTNKCSVKFEVYRCPMSHRCKCFCCVVTSADYIELQRSCLHDRNSHEKDESKKLSYVQRVSVKEAAKSAHAFQCCSPQELARA